MMPTSRLECNVVVTVSLTDISISFRVVLLTTTRASPVLPADLDSIPDLAI